MVPTLAAVVALALTAKILFNPARKSASQVTQVYQEKYCAPTYQILVDTTKNTLTTTVTAVKMIIGMTNPGTTRVTTDQVQGLSALPVRLPPSIYVGALIHLSTTITVMVLAVRGSANI